MTKRIRLVGIILAVVGVIFLALGGGTWNEVQAGQDSLQAFSEAQNVTLSYNEDGQLVDRGTPEGAAAIMSLLTDDWGYAVVESDLDAADPLVNTGSEYMYQMATIAYHTLHGTQTIVLTEDVEYNSEFFAAGTYEFDVDGRYWTDFDRSHPLEGPARSQAWSATAHALIGELGVGTVTASALQLGMALAGAFAGMGVLSLVAGGGLFWAGAGKDEGAMAEAEQRSPLTATPGTEWDAAA